MSKFTIRFLTREHCPLCDEARPVVLAAVARFGGEVAEVDVDGSAGLKSEYGSRVPVALAPDGTVVAEGRIERRDLNRGLRRLRRSVG